MPRDTPQTPLTSASTTDLQRLLKLFPYSVLRTEWPESEARTKEDLTLEVAGARDFARIRRFALQMTDTCHQHVLVFDHEADPGNPPRPLVPPHSAELLSTFDGGLRALYVLSVEFRVHLINPYDLVTVNYLWPFVVEMRPGVLVARFVKLSRNLRNIFPDRHLKTQRPETSRNAIAGALGRAFDSSGGLREKDLNQGLKALVEDEALDGVEVRLRDAHQTVLRSLHPDRLMKQDLPADVYAEFRRNPVLRSRFKLLGDDPVLDQFGLDPTSGHFDFPVQTPPGATRHVVESVIARS